MRRLIWSDLATADFFEIADRYDAIAPALSEMLLDRIIASPAVSLDHPEAGPMVEHRGLRKWTVPASPFLLLCRVLDSDTVEVSRVHDARRNWQR